LSPTIFFVYKKDDFVMLVTTKHIFDEPKIYPWDVLYWVEEGQTEYDEDLDLGDTNITHLPDNMTVYGYLNLYSTNITKLPDNLRVEYSLFLGHTNITQLSDDLYVGSSLFLRDTNIGQVPDTVTVKGTVHW